MGVIKEVMIVVFGVESEVDMYVMPSKGEGYALILGRAWLISMKVDQDASAKTTKMGGDKEENPSHMM